jgi:hypothetical protein
LFDFIHSSQKTCVTAINQAMATLQLLKAAALTGAADCLRKEIESMRSL